MVTARRDGLVIENAGGEVLVYDLNRHQAHCLNPTAAGVWQHCDGKMSVADLATQCAIDEETVVQALETLSQANLLQEPWTSQEISRREFVQKAGVMVALATPLILSLTAPLPANAQSQGFHLAPEGDNCYRPPGSTTTNPDGQSNHPIEGMHHL